MTEPIVHERFCIECREIKPFKAFHNDGIRALGRRCYTCSGSLKRGTKLPSLKPSRNYCPLIEKHCPNCKKVLPVAMFRRCAGNKCGLQSWCKSCQREKVWAYKGREWFAAKQRRAQAKYYRKNKHREFSRQSKLKYMYSMTAQDYEDMLEAQGGACAICKQPPLNGKRLAVDHDHETGKVRGLLCGRHNTALGMLNDDPDLIQAAKDYLLAHLS